MIGHNLKHDAHYLAARLAVSDATVSLDLWNKTYAKIAADLFAVDKSLKKAFPNMSYSPEVGDLVLVEPTLVFGGDYVSGLTLRVEHRSPRENPRLASVAKHAVSPLRVLVVFKDTGEEAWIESYRLASIDIVEALAWLAE